MSAADAPAQASRNMFAAQRRNNGAHSVMRSAQRTSRDAYA